MCRDIHPRTSVHICTWDQRYQERKDEREHKELSRAQERLTAYYQVREMGAGLNWATALLANANDASVTCLALPPIAALIAGSHRGSRWSIDWQTSVSDIDHEHETTPLESTNQLNLESDPCLDQF